MLLNGQPVLEFYDVHQTSKWGALGYESLFFVFFFLAAWTVSILLLLQPEGLRNLEALQGGKSMASAKASLESGSPS